MLGNYQLSSHLVASQVVLTSVVSQILIQAYRHGFHFVQKEIIQDTVFCSNMEVSTQIMFTTT
jgi:hypothetical protein